MSDAERERASGLADHDLSPAIPRTLWRVRNDVIQTIRTLESPLAESAAERLEARTAALLRGEADFVLRCADALRSRTTVDGYRSHVPFTVRDARMAAPPPTVPIAERPMPNSKPVSASCATRD